MWRWICRFSAPLGLFHCWHWYDEGIEVETTPRGCEGPRAFKEWDYHSYCCHCTVVRSGLSYADDTHVYFKKMPEVKR